MTSEIMQCAVCCNGPTNGWSKYFETKPRESHFNWHVKTV